MGSTYPNGLGLALTRLDGLLARADVRSTPVLLDGTSRCLLTRR